jgi:hypothetical protein
MNGGEEAVSDDTLDPGQSIDVTYQFCGEGECAELIEIRTATLDEPGPGLHIHRPGRWRSGGTLTRRGAALHEGPDRPPRRNDAFTAAMTGFARSYADRNEADHPVSARAAEGEIAIRPGG